MRAYICDACKKSYRPYVLKAEGAELDIPANGMTFVKIDREGKLHNKGKLELCPDCMEKIIDYVFDDLCVDDAPFIDKVKYYMEKEKERKEKASDSSED